MVEVWVVRGPKDNMLFWNTSMKWRYVGEETTTTGTHEPALMVSVSRMIKPSNEINKKAIEVLPKKVRKDILERYSAETLAKAPLTLKDRFQNIALDSVNKINKTLLKTIGISIEREAGAFEVFEYLKYRKEDMENYKELLYGFSYGLGILCFMNNLKPSELMEMRKNMELKLGKFFMLGYEKAKEKSWE